jgi:glycerol-3-phosphate dehydrogenase
MAKLNVKGASMYEAMCAELDVPFIRVGALVLAFSERDRERLETLLARGRSNGVGQLEIIGRDKLAELEPNISEDALCALSAPTSAITCPYELTIALCENAASNGVKILLNHAVRAVERTDNGWELTVGGTKITADYVINAAGTGAPYLSSIAGAGEYEQTLRRGEYCLLDKSQSGLVTRTIFQVPNEMGKGVLVTPAVDGNILIGPTADADGMGTATTNEGQRLLLDTARLSVPNIPPREIINSFCGIRAVAGDDFQIAITAPNWINVLGICSPGLTAAPAIGEYVRELLFESINGQLPELSPGFLPIRKGIPREGDLPLYGHIVCRCEAVTEGEIVAAIHRIIPATTVDGVKRRVRAGMGRCQGGFCLPRILEIIARETGIGMDEVTKTGGASYILAGKIR